MVSPEVSFGYAALVRDRFKLAPYAGIGGIGIYPPTKKTDSIPELKEISMSAFTCNFGINFDVKLGKKGYSFRPETSYWFLRIRYGFCLVLKRNEGILDNIHYITIGFGTLSRGVKREY